MGEPRRRLQLWLSSATVLLALPCVAQVTDDDCLGCHGTDEPVVDRATLAASTHARLACVECHRDVQDLPHPDDLVPVSCARCHADEARAFRSTVHGQTMAQGATDAVACGACHGPPHVVPAAGGAFRRTVPATCGKCHAKTASAYARSIHGKAALAGVKEAPVCTDCHGEHRLQPPQDPASSVSAGAVTRTCSACHASEKIALKFGLPVDRLESYLNTYHGLAYSRKDATVANCASCHHYHETLPSSDPASMTHPSNLPRTCGRCHPGAGAQLAGISIHRPPREKHWLVGLARSVYLVLIPATLGFMLLHNGLDLLKKARSPRRPAAEGGIRLTVLERLQHAVLAASFVVLALTGFALSFPDNDVLRHLAPASEDARRSVHRWAAAVFCALALLHVLYLAFTSRGRAVIRGLAPRWHDARALLQHFAFTLGLRAEPPERHGEWNYTEKVEYWALVWGSAVMALTGALLVFSGLVLRYLPAWTSDLATIVHYYEAVLACLSILVWHGYMVVFDPQVYPMNWAWLTGRTGLGAGEE